MITTQEIERRKPVWIALSEMYLDTELDDQDIQRIVKVLLESGYSWENLTHIHYNEVAPVVWLNLWSEVGEWAGFDEEWLYESILQKMNNKQTGSVSYKVFKWYINIIINRCWNKISIEFNNKKMASYKTFGSPAKHNTTNLCQIL